MGDKVTITYQQLDHYINHNNIRFMNPWNLASIIFAKLVNDYVYQEYTSRTNQHLSAAEANMVLGEFWNPSESNIIKRIGDAIEGGFCKIPTIILNLGNPRLISNTPDDEGILTDIIPWENEKKRKKTSIYSS